MLPIGVPSLLRLKKLLKLAERTNEYGRCTGGLAGGFAVVPLGAVGAGAFALVVAGPPGGGALGAIAGPNLNTFATLKFTETKPGPRPKFRGMIVWPAEGFGSNAPKGVTTTPGLFRSVANAGRSLKNVSPFVSRPVVILKGWPELAIMNVFMLTPCGP